MLKENLKFGKNVPNRIEAVIGRNLREMRLNRNLTQKDIAAELGISFQQVQKYELGINRISASVLYQCSQFLNTPILSFFAGTQEDVAIKHKMQPNKDEMHLVEIFRSIDNPKVKNKIIDLLSVIVHSAS